MAKLNIAPTKSGLLSLRKLLSFAREGYDLLDQKRQILVFELMSRLGRAMGVERRLNEAMARAFAALKEALLDAGSAGLERAALGVRLDPSVEVREHNVMGIRTPSVQVRVARRGLQYGLAGTTASTDATMKRFAESLERLAELAELETTVIRLARELRKTQRRCNALSKIFIPNCRETIGYIQSSLEERERESFVVMKMIKGRMAVASEGSGGNV